MLDFLLERSLLPGFLMRLGIYCQLRQRLRNEKRQFANTSGENKMQRIHALKDSVIAMSTDEANQQHYEVPTRFYQYILGPRLKYSCCYYSEHNEALAVAEEAMLARYCERAKIENGQSILDLGCGWGSLSLYLAEKYPDSKIVAVSNSATQKQYIDYQAAQQNLTNLTVITADINSLVLHQQFDRIMSVEMFEHVRNYQKLMSNIAAWLLPDGLLFVHHFCHQYLLYSFNVDESWMAKQFFQDGLMPSNDLLLFFADHFLVESRWRVNGRHYAKTCYAWLDNLFDHKADIVELFSKHYTNPKLRFQYWQLFLRACAQLFAYGKGDEWFVTHYLFKLKPGKIAPLSSE